MKLNYKYLVFDPADGDNVYGTDDEGVARKASEDAEMTVLDVELGEVLHTAKKIVEYPSHFHDEELDEDADEDEGSQP